VAARWVDLVDPSREEVLNALPPQVDPEVAEALAAPALVDRDPRPVVEGHGSYVFAVLVAMEPTADGVRHQEIAVVATQELIVTARKTPPGATPFDPSALHPAIEAGEPVGVVFHRLVDDVADSYLGLLDAVYGEIDRLEDAIDTLPPAQVRVRLAEIRHELLHRRRTVSATRGGVRRVLDGRVEVNGSALFPARVERLFADTYDTLVRVTEELDVARDLLASVRDHLQAKVAESQNEVGKKLTVIASLVLVPSLVVGFFGQNFEGEFQKGWWTLAVSSGIILGSTAVQLALFRWRRWI
jgi:Mg2+ and Co2+ transporter CorA